MSSDEIIKVNIKNYILKKIDNEKVKEFAVKMERLEFKVVKVKLKMVILKFQKLIQMKMNIVKII